MSPSVPASQGQGCCATQHVKVSTDTGAALGYAKKAAKSDVDGHGRLNRAKTKKTYGQHTSLLAGLGAGWWSRTSSWKHFTHTSTKDKKAIEKWAKTHKLAQPDGKHGRSVYAYLDIVPR